MTNKEKTYLFIGCVFILVVMAIEIFTLRAGAVRLMFPTLMVGLLGYVLYIVHFAISENKGKDKKDEESRS